MVKSTLEDMILFMYDDLNDGVKNSQIMKEMDENWVLKEKYKILKESYERLKKMKLLSPRQRTVDAIVKYASSKSVLTSR